MINGTPNAIEFGIHEGTPGEWKRFVDTSLASPQDILEPEETPTISTISYDVQGRSVVVLLKKTV